jgi:hypothetical protein
VEGQVTGNYSGRQKSIIGIEQVLKSINYLLHQGM